MTKHQEKRLEKATDKILKKKEPTQQTPLKIKIISIAFLLIMVFSLGSFALLQSPNSQTGGNVNEQGVPENLPFQSMESQGQQFWVAVKNYEVFQFQEPTLYQSQEDMQAVSNQLSQQSSVEIYQSQNFTDSNALYNLEKYLSASNIAYTRVQNQTCEESTIYLKMDSENNPSGNCMIISAEPGEEQIKVEALLYFQFNQN